MNKRSELCYAPLRLGISIFSDVQLLALGLIGKYVLQIYDQVRANALFVVDKVIKFTEQQPRG